MSPWETFLLLAAYACLVPCAAFAVATGVGVALEAFVAWLDRRRDR